ncbi:MAG: hypothetical protein ACLP50_27895 [Solirubrobacteraceae bacterium]
MSPRSESGPIEHRRPFRGDVRADGKQPALVDGVRVAGEPFNAQSEVSTQQRLMREVEIEVDPVPAPAPLHPADVARLREVGDVLADLVQLGV